MNAACCKTPVNLGKIKLCKHLLSVQTRCLYLWFLWLQFRFCINKTLECFGWVISKDYIDMHNFVHSFSICITHLQFTHFTHFQFTKHIILPGSWYGLFWKLPSLCGIFRHDEAIYMNNFLSIKLVSWFIDIVIVPVA